MPRFLFNIQTGSAEPQAEEVELADLQAAGVEAVRLMAGLLADQARNFWSVPTLKIIVTEETGLILLVLDLSGVAAPAVGDRLDRS